jgi:hypothetical protein
MSSPLHTVDRALRLLLAFGPRRRELTVTELADVLGTHKSTASRLAATIASRGFLKRDPASEPSDSAPSWPASACWRSAAATTSSPWLASPWTASPPSQARPSTSPCPSRPAAGS